MKGGKVAVEQMASRAPAARRLAERLRGTVIPAVLTPFRRDATVDEAALDRYAPLVARSGVGGLAVWAHTGRGPYLTAIQRGRVLRAFRQATDLPLIAGVAAPRTAGGPAGGASPAADGGGSAQRLLDEVLRAGEEALVLGADALMVFPPLHLLEAPARDEQVLHWHQRIAQALGAPVVLFLLHGAAGGFPYGTELLRALFRIPQVLGIKLATLDQAVLCQEVTQLVREEFPDALVITGEDRMFGPSLMWGADAALVGIASAAVELSTELVGAWVGRQAGRFLEASERLDRLARVTFTDPIEGYVQRMLWVAQWQGLIPAEAAFDPFGPRLPAGEQERVLSVVESLALRRYTGR